MTDGKVTKIGYPYADDQAFRYVQVTSGDTDHRYFYVEPSVSVGDTVQAGEAIGAAQDLTKRYPGITGHVHYEVKRDKEYLNPINFD